MAGRIWCSVFNGQTRRRERQITLFDNGSFQYNFNTVQLMTHSNKATNSQDTIFKDRNLFAIKKTIQKYIIQYV